LALTISRAYLKQDKLIQRLFDEQPKHPAVWVDNYLKKENKLVFRLFSVRFLIGIIIPYFCWGVLTAGAVCAWCGLINIRS
jgi:hypothetical protein